VDAEFAITILQVCGHGALVDAEGRADPAMVDVEFDDAGASQGLREEPQPGESPGEGDDLPAVQGE
jgi:hypothetical protein